ANRLAPRRREAANRQSEQRRHGEWQQPPPLRRCGDHERGRDSRGDAPVVADHELPDEPAEGLHAGAARLSPPTSAAEKRNTQTMITGRAASPPGQWAPAPSAAQNVPKVVSITPNAYLSMFSGTRASGARTANPTAVTSTTAAPAPAAASGIEPCAAPKVSTRIAAPTPVSAERQSRVVPIASTIVSASTISTALATKAEATRKAAVTRRALRSPRRSAARRRAASASASA